MTGNDALHRAAEAIASAPIGKQAETLTLQARAVGRLVAAGDLAFEASRRELVAAGMRMNTGGGREPWRKSQIEAIVLRAFDGARQDHGETLTD